MYKGSPLILLMIEILAGHFRVGHAYFCPFGCTIGFLFLQKDHVKERRIVIPFPLQWSPG